MYPLRAALLTLLVLFGAGVAAATVYADRTTYIYVFGTDQCPHCRAMHEWLSENYPDLFVYCEFSNPACEDAFRRLVEAGSPPYIPTIVFVNGTVRAILIGEHKNASLVEHLLSHPVGDVIPVYAGWDIIANLSGDLRDYMMNEILVNPTGNGSMPGNAGGAGGGETEVYLGEVDFRVLTLWVAVSDYRLCVLGILLLTVVSFALMYPRALGLTLGILSVAAYLSLLLSGAGVFPASRAGSLMLLAAGLSALLPEDFYNLYPRAKMLRSPLWGVLVGLLLGPLVVSCGAGVPSLFYSIVEKAGLVRALEELVVYTTILFMPMLVVVLGVVVLFRSEAVGNVVVSEKTVRMARLAGALLALALGFRLL